MIRTGIADIRPLLEEQIYWEHYKRIPKFRQEKADRIRDQRKKAQSVGVWVLYERLRKMWGISGKVIYNLSHSGNYVLCSIGEEESNHIKVGCDLEEIKKIPTKLIRRYFSDDEQKYIFERENEEEQKEAFYRLWVLRESFMKATRRGIGLGFDSFEIRIKEENPELICMTKRVEGAYYLKEYFLDIPYCIAVCSTDEHFSEEIQKVEL